MSKKIKSFLIVLVFLFGLFAGANNASAQYAVPTCNSATLNGNVVTNGASTNAWFEWGQNNSIIYSTPTQTFSSDSNFSQVINGLQENSLYSFRAMASNQNGSSTGQIITFTTPSCGGSPTQTASPTATISSTPSCTAPCNVQISWSSANVASTINFYRNGTFIWNQQPNMSGSQTDWTVPQGTYQYCIRAVKADWVTETGDLACSTTTVNAATVIPPTPPAPTASPTATISSTPSCTAPCNVQVSWFSANVATTVKIYKNGIYLWDQAINRSGSETDWNVPQGTYQYCIRAVKADWVTQTGDLACSTTVVNAAMVIPPAQQNMSGTLTPATFSCIIPTGANSCNINFTWNTINPVATSAVTSSTGTVANGNSGSSSFAIPLGSKTFFLYNNAVLLDQKTVSATSTAVQTCQDVSASNYGGTSPCTYPTQVCQDTSAINYRGVLPCRYAQVTPATASTAGTNFTFGANSNTSTNTNTSTSSSTNINNNVNNNNVNVNVNGGSSTVQTCQDPSANNYGGAIPCTYAPQLCQDPSASNYHGVIPCTYPPQLCQDPTAVNYHGSLPCRYSAPTCQDTTANNYGGAQPCTYPPQLCQDPTAVNYHGSLPCRYPIQTCQDPNANNYGGSLPCNYYTQICQDSSAINYHGSLPCRYNNTYNNQQLYVTTNNATNIATSSATLNGYVSGNSSSYATAWFDYGTNTNFGYTTPQNSNSSSFSNYNAPIFGLIPNTTYYFRAVAQNSQGTVYGSTLSFNTTNNFINYISPPIYNYINPPANNQPTVVVFADKTNLPYNGAATVSWITTNATSCNASGGSVGWAGVKSIGPGSFYTGSLTSSKTYTLTCSNNFGSANDSVTINVAGQTIVTSTSRAIPTSLVLITSSVDRNQPIVPTIDNSRPHPGDEINYTVSYQNVGTGSITGLTLRIDLPTEVDYLSSNPSNPIRSGQTLIFNLGTLKANGQGTVTARVLVRADIPANTNLNFPATLSYIDPSGAPQTVTANVSAQVWGANDGINSFLGAGVFGSGTFLPISLLGWLILIILVLLLVYLSKHTYSQFKK